MKCNKFEDFSLVIRGLIDETIDVYDLIERFKYLGFNSFIIFSCNRNDNKSTISFSKEWGNEGETGYFHMKPKSNIVKNGQIVSLHVDAQDGLLGTFIDE